MKHLVTSLLFIFFSGLHSLSIAADATAAQQALDILKNHADWAWEEPISPIITQYQEAEFDNYQGLEKSKYMLNDLGMHKWGQQISETQDLFSLLFSFRTQEYQDQYRTDFEQASQSLSLFRSDMNQEVFAYHPGFDLNLKKLANKNSGRGVIIAVFDVFDATILQQQITRYPGATIEPIQNFGDPVALNHGNSVIDIILTLAPEATIIPVSAESTTYNDAMAYIRARDDINIVNMSRAFAQKEDELDPVFSEHLQAILDKKIVTKSIGNTGTDLAENLTPLRESLGLPPVGNLFSYDLRLISSFLLNTADSSISEHLLLAINLEPFSQQIALSATIPGNNPYAIEHSFSMPAEAVYSWATGNFESGSSFAAPQLAAISALLWQAYQKRCDANPNIAASMIVRALKETARASELGESNTGKGLPNSDSAFKKINSAPNR